MTAAHLRVVSFLLLLLYLNDDLRTAFQDGCKKIVDHLTTLGYPPEDPQGPDEINAAISKLYTDKVSTNTGKIVYTYHKHTGNPSVTGGCYGTIYCKGQARITSFNAWFPCNNPNHPEGHMERTANFYCSTCKSSFTRQATSNEAYMMMEEKAHTRIAPVCGKTENTIESAYIDFT